MRFFFTRKSQQKPKTTKFEKKAAADLMDGGHFSHQTEPAGQLIFTITPRKRDSNKEHQSLSQRKC
jgi:hypothetical protein